MAQVTRFMAKLGNMRKEADWIVYPNRTNGDNSKILIQSDKRICEFDPTTRKGMLSSGKGGHPGFMMLSKFMGAMEIEVPEEVVALALAHKPQSGDTLGSAGSMTVLIA